MTRDQLKKRIAELEVKCKLLCNDNIHKKHLKDLIKMYQEDLENVTSTG